MAFQSQQVSRPIYQDLGREFNEPVLPVKLYSPGRKPKTEPTVYADGEEYLLYVITEREKGYKSLPDTMVTGLKQNFVFPVQFKKKCLSEFLDASSQLKARTPKLKEILLNDKDLPCEGDMLSWCAFCLGVDAVSKVVKKSYFLEEKEKLSFEPNGFPPFLRLILNFSKRNVEELLFYLSIWLKTLGFTPRQGEWIYALLSVVKKPLSKRLANALQELFTVCSDVLKQLKNGNTDAAISLNIFIYILQQHFDCKVELKPDAHDERYFEIKSSESEYESESSESEDKMEM